MPEELQINENIRQIRKRMDEACQRAGRDPSKVRLIAVSKTKPASMVQEAYDGGMRDFGENHPQEIRDKAPVLPADVRWHMIGHLQRNKVKYVIRSAYMIHSLDSLALAEEISRQAVKAGRVMPVLAEVNVGGEESKYGLRPEDTEAFLRSVSGLPGISVQGLMTVAPPAAGPEDNREVFRRLRNLSIDIGHKNIDNIFMSELSMGMTGDFEAAIEEGATMVRVGTAIFGARDYGVNAAALL